MFKSGGADGASAGAQKSVFDEAPSLGGQGSAPPPPPPGTAPSRLPRTFSSEGLQPKADEAASLLSHWADAGGVRARFPAPGGGDPLPRPVQAKMERSFGTKLADVRVHQGSAAASLGAQAFTHGTDIHFAPGEYAPHSEAGQRLLGHELAHVVQQRAGRAGGAQNKGGFSLNRDAALEAEADAAGDRAARGRKATVAGAAPGPAGRGEAVQAKLMSPEEFEAISGDLFSWSRNRVKDIDEQLKQYHAKIPYDVPSNGEECRAMEAALTCVHQSVERYLKHGEGPDKMSEKRRTGAQQLLAQVKAELQKVQASPHYAAPAPFGQGWKQPAGGGQQAAQRPPMPLPAAAPVGGGQQPGRRPPMPLPAATQPAPGAAALGGAGQLPPGADAAPPTLANAGQWDQLLALWGGAPLPQDQPMAPPTPQLADPAPQAPPQLEQADHEIEAPAPQPAPAPAQQLDEAAYRAKLKAGHFEYLTKAGQASFDNRKTVARPAGMSKAELAAIRIYSAQDYKYMNPVLAGNERWLDNRLKDMSKKGEWSLDARDPIRNDAHRGQLKREAKEHSDMALQGLSKLPDVVGDGFRGMGLTYEDLMAQYSAGMQVHYPSFTSTSSSEDKAREFARHEAQKRKIPVLLHLKITKGKDIDAFSANKDEKEYLLVPGAVFTVVADPMRDDKGMHVVQMQQTA